MDILSILLIIILVLQLLVVCYSDIRHRIVTNKSIITIALTTLVISFTQHNTVSVVIPLVALIVGYILFHFKLIGGGDVKLITVLLLALTAEQSLNFILYTAIMGGVVMMIGMLINRADIQRRGVPYAVAIALGFLLSLYL
ncbi:A24 family peptidase [Yersinia enterocolitica]|uniref:Tight adherance operon protein n=1 Tax=Yersinia massiliensis TaxID=419257 RepID=A0ABM6UP25_9GAMM|nr:MULTISPECIES: prepilin peptidase [Yersinia]HEC1652513.1 prepilin peptidase [Yersinia enterocolitica]AVX36716.1 tight adherance operon protein [Yersinia massiliensis]QKJ11516.1 prepilin peptidase [Yersinia massiliensis]CNM02434.1 putative tight adherance operon protein [Yersinia frederiksenii]CQH60776.1 putative tight adherance operon protein [Yersinia frederiksenii]